MKRPVRREMFGRVVVGLLAVVFATAVGVAWAQTEDALDPAHNVALPCEAVSTPGLVPRSAKNIAHLANVCGFVGTDIEFQSRKAANGIHDYAFVGTMGAGLRIFDVTDPANPSIAGGYADPGWENDVQVRGDIAVLTFDPVGVTPKTSACLFQKSATEGGVDIVRLAFDPTTATFKTSLLDCVRTVGRGAHNATLHASGKWLAVMAPSGNGWVDVVDLRGAPAARYRIVGTSTPSTCPAGAGFTCIVTGTNWSPHDVSFSRDGKTMYVAAVNLTAIVDVRNVLAGQVSLVKVIPNLNTSGGLANPENIDISHQADVSADGKILLITDERGGGLSNTACNEDASGVIGAGHFWALKPVKGRPQTVGATPANPVKLGIWIYPNPGLAVDALEPVLAGLGRTERGCTIHVFRFGGNGTAGPGPIDSSFGGVSGLPTSQLTTAHYGAGVWHLSFTGPSSSTDGVPEDPRSTWGNTLGWNVMPGADTWSAKEYKGFIYAGDMTRGFDVYRFRPCEGAGCIDIP
jgi:LVIVD repeat-containing protein